MRVMNIILYNEYSHKRSTAILLHLIPETSFECEEDSLLIKTLS